MSSEFVQASTASLGEALASINPRLSIAAIALFVGYNAGPLAASADDLRWQLTVAAGQELKTLLKAAGETPLVQPATAPAAPVPIVQPVSAPASPVPDRLSADRAPVTVIPAPAPPPVPVYAPASGYPPVKLHRTWHGDHGGSRSTPSYRIAPQNSPKYSMAPTAGACGPHPQLTEMNHGS